MSDLAARLLDPERLAALRRLVLLDTGATEGFDRLARLAARTLHAPMALMTLVDGDRQYFKAAFGLPAPLDEVRETPLTYSICQYAVAMGAPLVVCDARVEHWLDDNPAITELGVTAYAGVPLITADAYAVGTLCVLDTSARDWTSDDLENLEDLAGVAMREIRLHRLERKVAHQRESRSNL
ncbi:MAG TPA: GAF domain-containing protein [Acidimicrobiales bacterium]|jgi:GAF domain-containing protein|nr:GAF domain-containing protein [Acidimicrobiales bacterium]